MSCFNCEHCGAVLVDTPVGYITECPHYMLSEKELRIALSYCHKKWNESLDKIDSILNARQGNKYE